MKNFGILFLALVMTGCGLAKSPEVKAPGKATGEIQDALDREIAQSAASAGVPPLFQGSEGGRVKVSLAMPQGLDPHSQQHQQWIYWKAGTNAVVYEGSPEFVHSDGWDIRITKRIPIIGTNGGETALRKGFAEGKAAFAVIPQAPGTYVPQTVVEVQNLEFLEDRKMAQEFQGMSFKNEYQSPVVNHIGNGFVSDYDYATHTLKLSHRVMVLRGVDGVSYYAIRFVYYSGRANVLAFDWRKLK